MACSQGLWLGERLSSVEEVQEAESFLWHARELVGGHPLGCCCFETRQGPRLARDSEPASPQSAAAPLCFQAEAALDAQLDAVLGAAVAAAVAAAVGADTEGVRGARQPHLLPRLQPQLRLQPQPPARLQRVASAPQKVLARPQPAPQSIFRRCGHDGGRQRRDRSAGGTPLGCRNPRPAPGGGAAPLRRARRDSALQKSIPDAETACWRDDGRALQRRCALLEDMVDGLKAQIETLQGDVRRAAHRESCAEQLCARLQGRLRVLQDRRARRAAPRSGAQTQTQPLPDEQQGDRPAAAESGLFAAGSAPPSGLPSGLSSPLCSSSPPRQSCPPPQSPGAPAASGSATAAARKPTLEGAAREPAVVAPYERTQPMAGTSSGSAVRSCATCVAPANQQLAGQAGAPAGAQRQSQSLTGLLGNLASLALTSAALALLPSAPPGPPAPPPAGQAAAVAPAAAPLSAAGLVPGLQGLVGAFWKGYKDGLASRACTRRACQHAAQGGQPGGPVPHQRVTAQRGAVQSSPEAKRAEAVRFLLSEVMVFRVAAHSPRAWAPVCRAAAAAVHWAMQCWAVAFQVEYDYVANSLRRQTGGGYGAGAGLGEIQDALADVSWLQSRLLRVDAATDVLADAKVFLMDTLSRRYLLLEEMGVELGSLHNVAAVNKLKASRSMEVIETILGTDEVVLPWT
eukprot:TRINITY_DN10971_c0_g3_i2.p1 TRINITY_DN10971_c0_g3~~TRINITY_DN10971_c0_g3_i2.p1  ORF type:complete len:685 (+),score=71.35 TRINITY_DN10971_c0_g3_i2:123-2177(+)